MKKLLILCISGLSSASILAHATSINTRWHHKHNRYDDPLRFSCQITGDPESRRVELYGPTFNGKASVEILSEFETIAVSQGKLKRLNKDDYVFKDYDDGASLKVTFTGTQFKVNHPGELTWGGSEYSLECVNHNRFPNGVTIYTEPYYRGEATTLTGRFHTTLPQPFRDVGVASFRAPKGVTIIFCNDKKGDGDCWRSRRSQPILSVEEDHRIESIGAFRF